MAKMTRLTEKEAAKEGYRIVRGAYLGTTDDRADRWYVDHGNDAYVNRVGGGFVTKAAALLRIERELADNEYWAGVEAAYERRAARQ